ncbi:MAG: hypothetical protein IT374_13235 [Polyangiaceae bacterium]|nr:hypothetical protein [Polyangiaceae bacterium]
MNHSIWIPLLLLSVAACEPELPEATNAPHNVKEPLPGAGGGAPVGGAPATSGAAGAATAGASSAGAAGAGGSTVTMATGTVGKACKQDAECTGYGNGACVTSIAPLKGKITDPTHPQAAKFENELVMPFPNGYCATTIDHPCPNDAACGPGAGCFRGLDGVDKAVLADLDKEKTADGMHPFLPFSTVAFADVGICMKPCTADAECRQAEGYTCAVPMGTLIGVINPAYTRKFCVGPFTFSL